MEVNTTEVGNLNFGNKDISNKEVGNTEFGITDISNYKVDNTKVSNMGGDNMKVGNTEVVIMEVVKGMMHLTYKLYLKAVFLCVKVNDAIGFFLKNVCFSRKAHFKKISVRSQYWCLKIPKLVCDNPKNGA